MTDDFKSKIITYLCGKYEIQNKEDKPTIEQIKETTNNFTDNLKAELKSKDTKYIDYIYMAHFKVKMQVMMGLIKH